jgi:LmbE family N-acetylglucosaminyl deacetylase
MKLSFAKERVLAVMAHPDDAELLCAGTLARAKKDGAAIGVVVMCAGDKGKASGMTAADLGRIRQGEANEAAKVLGTELLWFGARDGELFDTYDARRRLIELYRQFRPTLIIAHPPEDYHPDHRAASALSEAASWFAASRGHVTESQSLDAQPKLWFADTLAMTGFKPEFYVDVTGTLEVKKQMLACHRSQIERGPDGDFRPLMDLMLRQCHTRGEEAGVASAEVFRSHPAFKRIAAL